MKKVFGPFIMFLTFLLGSHIYQQFGEAPSNNEEELSQSEQDKLQLRINSHEDWGFCTSLSVLQSECVDINNGKPEIQSEIISAV